MTEVLRRLVGPGDGVVVMPPVYPPFWQWLDDVGARAVEVPLLEPDRGGRLDLPGIERALAAGARVVLLCSPQNPTGRVHPVEEASQLVQGEQRYVLWLAEDLMLPRGHRSAYRPGQEPRGGSGGRKGM